MQEQLLHAAEPGRRPAQQQFVGVDLRRPKGYAAAAPSSPPFVAKAAPEGEPCPRCESRDTKFCYYNNYNTSQPRHFCKACRRYWTKGGTLRIVPVGGGTRKRPTSSSSASVKRQKPYKKRRATPPEPPTAAPADDAVLPAPDAAAAAKTTETTTTPPAEASASEITTELVVPAAAAAEEDSFTELLQHGGEDAVALDIGFYDYLSGGGKALTDTYSFEWPPALDLGACWGGTGFGADTDPGVFMNLP